MVIYLQVIAMTGTTAEISPAAVIDTAESVIWVRRYDTPGEFELYFAADKYIFKLIKENIGYLIMTREDRQDVMYVEYAKLTESEENGDRILLKGRSIDCVMGKRVIGYPTIFTITPVGAAIKELIEENMIEPTPQEGYMLDPLRRVLSPFRFVMPVVYGSPLSRTYNGENLLEAVGELLKKANCGLRCTLEDGEIIMQLYRGQDRPNVKFSPNNENLISSEYECDIRGQCNTAFVYATGDEDHVLANGSNPYTLTRQYPQSQVVQYSNFARYEGFMTGSADTWATGAESVTEWVQGTYAGDTGEPTPDEYAVRCETYYEIGVKISATWGSTFGDGVICALRYYNSTDEYIGFMSFNNGGTVTPPADARKIRITLLKYHGGAAFTPADVTSFTLTALRSKPKADYKSEIAKQGAALMTSKTDSISGETIETGLYRLGVDYDLGDTVRVENSYGVAGTAKVEAITEVEDAEGYRIYPTFTDWTVT